MLKVVFVDPEGARHEVDVEAGNTIMEAAIDNDVPGIVAECGGACACATCHAYVDEKWVGRLPEMDDMEDAMLDSALDRTENSRLTCQISMTNELDGIEIVVAHNGD
jgi:2Fe-2S ferredoxin